MIQAGIQAAAQLAELANIEVDAQEHEGSTEGRTLH